MQFSEAKYNESKNVLMVKSVVSTMKRNKTARRIGISSPMGLKKFKLSFKSKTYRSKNA